MTHHKSYKNESQDARRHDKHDATHPETKEHKEHTKPEPTHGKKNK